MSYQMQLNPRKKKAARFVTLVNKEIQKTFTDAANKGMTQRKLAAKLDVDKSVLHRRLTGETNLTLRSIADLAWALDADLEFSMRPKSVDSNVNYHTLNKQPAATATHALGAAPTITNTTQNSALGKQTW